MGCYFLSVKTKDNEFLYKDERCESIEEAIEKFSKYILSQHTSNMARFSGMIDIENKQIFALQISANMHGVFLKKEVQEIEVLNDAAYLMREMWQQ